MVQSNERVRTLPCCIFRVFFAIGWCSKRFTQTAQLGDTYKNEKNENELFCIKCLYAIFELWTDASWNLLPSFCSLIPAYIIWSELEELLNGSYPQKPNSHYTNCFFKYVLQLSSRRCQRRREQGWGQRAGWWRLRSSAQCWSLTLSSLCRKWSSWWSKRNGWRMR